MTKDFSFDAEFAFFSLVFSAIFSFANATPVYKNKPKKAKSTDFTIVWYLFRIPILNSGAKVISKYDRKKQVVYYFAKK